MASSCGASAAQCFRVYGQESTVARWPPARGGCPRVAGGELRRRRRLPAPGVHCSTTRGGAIAQGGLTGRLERSGGEWVAGTRPESGTAGSGLVIEPDDDGSRVGPVRAGAHDGQAKQVSLNRRPPGPRQAESRGRVRQRVRRELHLEPSGPEGLELLAGNQREAFPCPLMVLWRAPGPRPLLRE